MRCLSCGKNAKAHDYYFFADQCRSCYDMAALERAEKLEAVV